MDPQKCDLCLRTFSPTGPATDEKQRNFPQKKQQRIDFGADENNPVKNRLEVIYLLRKVLEIPQDVCCQFLRDYGDPSSWIHCCDSCSTLTMQCKIIFDQITVLEIQYEQLRNKMKDVIIQSSILDRSNDQSKCGIKESVRSFIIQAHKPKEVKFEDFFCERTELDTISTPNWNSDLEPSNYIDENDSSLSQNLPHTNDTYAPEYQHPLKLGENDKTEGNTVIKVESCSSFENEDTESQETNELNDSSSFDEYNVENVSSFTSVQLPEEATTSDQDNEKTFKCEVCSKCFTCKRGLNDHKKLHTGEGLHYCSVCGKSFTRTDTLIRHELIHTAKKSYKCPLCRKCFAGRDELKKHKLIHTEKKPYKCKLCEKGFKHASSLKDHIKSHTGNSGSYQCSLCGKIFVKLDSFKRHMNSHTGHRPYKCDICGKDFSRSDVLAKHKTIHTKQKPYTCTFCGKCYSSSFNFRRHAKIHLQENLESV